MRFSARVCSRRRCTRHGCTPAEETGTISQLDFGCGARRICVRLAHVASTWPEGSPAAQRCEHALISLACRHAAHGMSTRVQGIKPLRCASFTAVKQPSWACTWPPPPQPLCSPTVMLRQCQRGQHDVGHKCKKSRAQRLPEISSPEVKRSRGSFSADISA